MVVIRTYIRIFVCYWIVDVVEITKIDYQSLYSKIPISKWREVRKIGEGELHVKANCFNSGDEDVSPLKKSVYLLNSKYERKIFIYRNGGFLVLQCHQYWKF